MNIEIRFPLYANEKGFLDAAFIERDSTFIRFGVLHRDGSAYACAEISLDDFRKAAAIVLDSNKSVS